MTVQQDGVDDTPQLKEYAQRCLRLAYTAQSPRARRALWLLGTGLILDAMRQDEPSPTAAVLLDA